MFLFLKSNINKENYFNLLLFLVPFSFIAGNMIININVILIIFSVLFFYHKDLFKIELNLLDKLIVLYFFLIFFTGIYNIISIYLNYEEFSLFKKNYLTLLKSTLFLKYLLLYFSIRLLVEKNIVNLKYFFISCTISVLFVCLDIFLQFFSGQDIFGYKAEHTGRKLSGPFGSELIAGSFIQRFSIEV